MHACLMYVHGQIFILQQVGAHSRHERHGCFFWDNFFQKGHFVCLHPYTDVIFNHF